MTIPEEKLAKTSEYIKKWERIGTCTDPADRERAVMFCKEAYEKAGYTPASIFIWYDSPIEGAVAAAILSQETFTDDLANKLGPQGIYDYIKERYDEFIPNIPNQIYNAGFGQHDANWLGFYDFFLHEMGETRCEILSGLNGLAQTTGWYWPFTTVCIMTDRHDTLKFDENNNLHCEDGPALRYRNGHALYYWHGTSVEKRIIEQPDSITVNEIMTQRNATIRQIMQERYKGGFKNFLKDAKAKMISSGHDGQLYELQIQDDTIKFLNLKCPSSGHETILRVNPEQVEFYAAKASTFGLSREEYMQGMVQET